MVHLGKVKDIVYDLRKMTNNSTLSRNLEQAVTRYSRGSNGRRQVRGKQ